MSLPDVTATDWPEILWTDYPFAAVRLTTVVHGGAAYLLFGYVELIPEETPHPCDYHIKAPNFLRKSRIEVSLSVLPSREALQWYESALSGQLVVPKISSTVPIQTIKLAPEPRIGCFIAAATPPIVAQWHAHPRMHRLVPMQEIPAIIKLTKEPPRQATLYTQAKLALRLLSEKIIKEKLLLVWLHCWTHVPHIQLMSVVK